MAENRKCGFDGGDPNLDLPHPPQTVREHMEQIARQPLDARAHCGDGESAAREAGAILPQPRPVAQVSGELHTARTERLELLKEVGRWAAIQTPPITIVDGVVHQDMPPVPAALTDAIGRLNEEIARLEYELWDRVWR